MLFFLTECEIYCGCISEFCDKDRLKFISARGFLRYGNLESVNENIKYLHECGYYPVVDDLRDSRLIEFDKCNRKYYKMKAQIVLKVNVKNVESLTVNIFEINTKSYYRKNKQELQTDLNLDGFTASDEWVLDSSELKLNNNFHVNAIDIPFPEKYNNKRGIYFVDLIGSGIHARAVVRKGNIRQIENIVCCYIFFL